MLTLKEFLTEDKNLHMTHLEDLVFDGGVNGTRKAINFLQNLRDMLSGNGTSKVTVTSKYDGAPAVFVGIDPTDGKFFVAKKGIFNKNAKVYKTDSEIDADTSGSLSDKLKISLAEFKKLGIKSGVYQGDLMFTSEDLKTETIDGVKYITFHPNTIVYAVPFDSVLGKKIRSAKIGVVWHTTYTGDSFETMTASFGKGIVEHMRQTSSVWMDDATYRDYSGVATFNKVETAKITSMLSEVGVLFKTLNGVTLNAISVDEDLRILVNTYNNSKVRAGETIKDVRTHVIGLFDYIHEKFQKEIDKKATDKSKDIWEKKRKKIMSFFANHDQSEIIKIFKLSKMVSEIKQIIINKMNQVGDINTFIKTSNGFKITGVEGFVAIDHLNGGAIKLVDRMEFSKNNFSPEVLKGWH